MSQQVFETLARFRAEELYPRALIERWSTTRAEVEGLSWYRHRTTGFSLSRVFFERPRGVRLDGFEAEQLDAWALAATGDRTHDPTSFTIPWHELRRDLSVANAGQGGLLTATETMTAADALRPWSVTARAGITVVEKLRGAQILPKTAAKSTIYWSPNEASGATESQPTLGSVAASPKTAIGVVEFSRQLDRQSGVESYLRRELLRTAGSARRGSASSGIRTA
jgi:HK97 family phage major capsid protein